MRDENSWASSPVSPPTVSAYSYRPKLVPLSDKRPNIMLAVYGFNRYTEQLNGRVAMIAIIIIFMIESVYNINILSYLYLKRP